MCADWSGIASYFPSNVCLACLPHCISADYRLCDFPADLDSRAHRATIANSHLDVSLSFNPDPYFYVVSYTFAYSHP